MRLIHRSTGDEVKIGDRFERDGKIMVASGWQKPTSPASTGRIHVCEPHQLSHALTLGQSFFPDVYDCEWVEREDRED